MLERRMLPPKRGDDHNNRPRNYDNAGRHDNLNIFALAYGRELG
jgi:hypothetical protein